MWKRQTARMRKALWQKACELHEHWPRSDSGMSCWTEPRAPHIDPAACPGCSMIPREVALIEIAVLDRCVALAIPPTVVATDLDARKRVARDLLVDLSQGVQRKPWMVGGIGRVTTHSRWYSCDRDAVLQPEELWANYGRYVAGADSATHLPISSMQRLLGDCMAVQPVAALVHAMICEYGGRIPGLWSPSAEQSRASSDAASLQHPS